MDFHKINRPCTCTVISSFVGDILVILKEKVVINNCNTQVNLTNKRVFGCPSEIGSSLFDVQINSSFLVHAEFINQATTGTFHHCLGFNQNGIYNT